MTKLIRRIKLFDQAQTMVEFALVLPILAVLIFGLLEVGRMAFMYSTIATASREAVRYGSATGDVSTGSSTKKYADCAGIRAAAQKVDFLDVISDANILITYDHGPGTTWSGALCPVGGTGPTSIKSGDRIRVIVSGDFNPIVGLVPLSARTITSSNYHTLIGNVLIVQPGFCPYNPAILDTDPACVVPTEVPTGGPTEEPTQEPTGEPTGEPTEEPTVIPACGITTATTPQIAGDLRSVTWSVTNTMPLTINSVLVNWPAASGNLINFTIDTTSLGAGIFPASPSTTTIPGGNTLLPAGTHQFKYFFGANLANGSFSTTLSFIDAGCSSVSGSVGVFPVTHAIPFPNALSTSKTTTWTLNNHTGLNLQISSIVITWSGGLTGICNVQPDGTNLLGVSLGSKSWLDTKANTQLLCNGFYLESVTSLATWVIPPGSSSFTLTFQDNGVRGITTKIYLASGSPYSSYIVDSTNPLQKD